MASLERAGEVVRVALLERLEQHHLLAELRKDGGGLQPDIAATDDDRVGHAGKLGHHAIGVGAGAHRVDAGEIMAGNVLGKGYTAGVGMSIGTAFGRIAGTEAARAAIAARSTAAQQGAQREAA